jgi:hypothetical protein
MKVLQKSLIGKVATHYIDSLAKDKELQLFFVTVFFYLALSLCVSNITMLGAVLVYVGMLYRITKNVGLTLLSSFVAVLPFSNGKSFSMLLVPKQLVTLPGQKDVYVYASMRISDILLGAYLYYFLTRRSIVLPKQSSAIATCVLLLFVFVALISFVFSVYPEGSAIDVLQLCKIVVVFMIVLTSKKYAKVMWTLAAASALFEGCWGVAQYFHGGRLGRYIEFIPPEYGVGKFAWEQPDLLRVSGTFIDPDLFGTFLLMQTGLLIATIQTQTMIIQKKLLIWVAIIVGIVGVVLSGNRVLYVVTAIMFYPLIRIIRLRSLLRIILRRWFIMASILAGVIIVPYISIRLTGLSTLFSPTGSGTFRLQMIVSSLRLGFEHLIGVGVGMSPVYLATKSLVAAPIYGADFPHNLFMQIFAETGIMGFILFIIFLYVAFRSFFLRRAAMAAKPFYTASAMFFIASMFYPLTFDGIEILSIGFLYLGMANALKK